MLIKIREPLLAEAKQSPSLLSDLAGLEAYIAESYDSRSFIELLQNADDAGATRFLIEKCGAHLIVANDGRNFSEVDFESLCRSASSKKSRGASIGYRGIGFKSIVGLAQKAHLFSGELEATFCRERTAAEIPEACRVPLIRIPHSITPIEKREFFSSVKKLQADGFVTLFVFSNLLDDAIDGEFEAFDPSSLLFLRNIHSVSLNAARTTHVSISRKAVGEGMQAVTLVSGSENSDWLLIERHQVSIAFSKKNKSIRKLDERLAVVHAFLPTNEATGLSVKLHGDISTDPSRTRVVFDERTQQGIQHMAELVLSLVEGLISKDSPPETAGMLAALLPISDPRLSKLQKRSFKSALFDAIAAIGSHQYASLKCRPQWLNSVDFEMLAKLCKINVLPRKIENIDGAVQFFKFLGVRPVSFNELMKGFTSAKLTVSGLAEVMAEIIRNASMKQITYSDICKDWPLWLVGGAQCSLNQALSAQKPLDDDFRYLVSEKTGGESVFHRFLVDLCGEDATFILLPQKVIEKEYEDLEFTIAEKILSIPQKIPPISKKPLSLKRWRGAEEQVLNILQVQGWKAEDVSRQNVGYDIECKTPDGEAVFIEVKLVGSSDKPFTLTSNEEAVAREKGDQYVIAIVCQSRDFLEVAFIKNPVQHLTMIRQCRQWVWECSDYPYEPLQFPLE